MSKREYTALMQIRLIDIPSVSAGQLASILENCAEWLRPALQKRLSML